MGFEGKYLIGGLGLKLFPNQQYNVRRLIHRRRALLSDKVGSGKTLSCLYAFAYLKERGVLSRAVVLTPLSAYEKRVWLKDVEKFTSLRAIDIEDLLAEIDRDGNEAEVVSRYDVIYGKHTHLKNDVYRRLIQRIIKRDDSLLIVDEVHAFKNPRADISKACKEVSRVCKNYWGLTGSSISRDAEDLYHIVSLIHPGCLGRWNEFRDRWCIVKQKRIGWDKFRECPKTAMEVVGFKDEDAIRAYLEPLMICGESFFDVKFTYLDYELSDSESKLYRKIARGINLNPELDENEWLRLVLESDEEDNVPKIKAVDAYSSRFIYLQSVVDGTLLPDGTLLGREGTKLDMCLDKIREIVGKGQSCIVYFDYLASLDAVKDRILCSGIDCDVLESSGRHVLDATDVTEERCRVKPIVILGTRASSESVSYYFINNVIFYNIPSVPHVFIQLVGRITRKNSLYPDDLNVYILRSNNIDLYKLILVSYKTHQLEAVQGREGNVPDTYKDVATYDVKEAAKKLLLWGDKRYSGLFD